jgi:NAD kinase
MLTDSVASAILGWQEGQKDILQANPGYQFVCLGELTGQPCIPVFTVGNNSTGLNIQSVAAASTDTPVINLNLAKVG